jgi:hypothetical protein
VNGSYGPICECSRGDNAEDAVAVTAGRQPFREVDDNEGVV